MKMNLLIYYSPSVKEHTHPLTGKQSNIKDTNNMKWEKNKSHNIKYEFQTNHFAETNEHPEWTNNNDKQ